MRLDVEDLRRPGTAFVVGLLVGVALTALLLTGRGGDTTTTQPVSQSSPDTARQSQAPTALSPDPALDPPAPTSSDDGDEPGSRDEDEDEDEETSPVVTLPVARAEGPPAPLPSSEPVTCPEATVTVRTAVELQEALAAAAPGTSIEIADGTYSGTFVATADGTPEQPIWLCGGPGAVLDGGGIKKGYALHLAPARFWRVVGFTVRNSQKGVVADATRGTVVQGLTVEDIGDEAIHLRSFSTGSAVIGNTIRRTGQRREKFGEGVYVGSATSNWPKYSGGEPDRSDNNLVHANRISETTSESVDVKEGTTGGVVSDNTFDGSALTGADSWVDIKGNDWTIRGNTGANTPLDGFQTHEILDGWGTRNTFTANVADVTGVGFGFHLAPARENVVRCDNRTSTGVPATYDPACTD